jgi:hypothetical protein
MLESLRGRISARYRKHEFVLAAGIILFLGILTYLPFANQLGFYRDDWYILWAGRAFNPNIIVDLFQFDRPLVGYIYSTVYRALGENALLWQIYSFSLRAIGALSFFWLIRQLWPDRKVETTTAATLMLLYPGFLQWANAMTKSNHITTYTVALLSISFTAAALQSTKSTFKFLWSLAALCSAVTYWFLYEYMIGLEVFRLLVIGLLIYRIEAQGWRASIRNTAKVWSPYLLLITAHILWRLFFFESGRQGMSVDSALAPYQAGLFRTLAKRLLVLAADVFDTLISAWVVPFQRYTLSLDPRNLLLTILVGLSAALIFSVYYLAFSSQSLTTGQAGKNQRTGIQMLLLGSVALIFSLLPVVMVGRDVRWESGFDKYTLQATAGVGLMLVGGFLTLGKPKQGWVLMALLIGVASTSQTGNAIQWKTFWEDQKDLWWQMSWRAPMIRPETVLLVEMPGKDYFEAYEVWGPANRVYAPDDQSLPIRAEVFSTQTLEKIKNGQSEVRGIRSVFDLERDFSKSLILSRPERTSCWHVIDGGDPVFPETTSGLLYATVRVSSEDRIITDEGSTSPPAHIYGDEPAHEWCYFYQLASLEAQRGNWDRVAALADQALDQDYKPIDRSEWLPFLRGLVMVGRNEMAKEMALWIRDIPTIRHRQCDYLSETSLPDPARQTYLREILCK